MQIIKKIFVLGVNLCKNNLSEGYIANLITVLFFLFVCLFVCLLIKCSSMQGVVKILHVGVPLTNLLTGLEPLRRSHQPWGVNLAYFVWGIHGQPHYCVGGLHQNAPHWGCTLIVWNSHYTPEMQTPHYSVKQTVFIFGPFSTWTVQNWQDNTDTGLPVMQGWVKFRFWVLKCSLCAS